MNPIRVFLVDDTAVVRRILVQILEEDPEVVVVGTANEGAQGLQRLGRVDADVLVLDIEMPGMGGLDMLAELRRERPGLPVIVFSSLTERGAMVTIEALSLGAADYVTKPTMTGSAAAARDYVKAALLPKVRMLGRRTQGLVRAAMPRPVAGANPLQLVPPARSAVPAAVAAPRGRVDAVLIGVSTGGPNALSEIVPRLPASLPVPVFVVQHMPALFTKALAQRLDTRSPLSISECDVPVPVRAGQMLLAAGGYHLRVGRNGDAVWARPDLSDPVNFCRPSVDVLFSTAVEVYAGNVLAVVMTGMGHDGLEGARAVRARGGQVIVQDEATSVVWGMPGAVHDAGLADGMLPLAAIPEEILKRVAVGRDWFPAPGAELSGHKGC